MSDQSIITIFTKITATFDLFMAVVSSILNPMIVYICLRSKRLRSTSTFKLFAIGAINDFFCNWPWNQEAFANSFFDVQLPYKSLFYCRWISVFLQFATFEITSWLLFSISLDRFLSMIVKKWTKSFFNGLKPLLFAIVLVLIIFAINFHLVFLGGYSYRDENGDEIVICYVGPPDVGPDWYFIMSQVLLYFGYLTPIILLVLINSLIIFKATQFQRSQKATNTTSMSSTSARRKAEMTRTVYTTSIFYIATTLPNIVAAGYFYNNIMSLQTGQIIINILNMFQSTYQAFHFFVLYFSNRLFAQEVKILFGTVKREQVSKTTKTQKSAVQTNHTREENHPDSFRQHTQSLDSNVFDGTGLVKPLALKNNRVMPIAVTEH